MSKIILAFILIGFVLTLLGAVIKILVIGALIVFGILLAVLVAALIYSLVRNIYHAFNPVAKEKYLSRKAKEQQEAQIAADKAAAEKTRKTEIVAENSQRMAAEAERARLYKEQQRDAETQFEPYIYSLGAHANEALAIRYGIANLERKRTSNPSNGSFGADNTLRSASIPRPSRTIEIRKVKSVRPNVYDVLLTGYSNRPVRAVIEPGTEYVKTFLPLDDSWFDKYADLELTLKGNGSFTLKELATFHVQKTIGHQDQPPPSNGITYSAASRNET